MKRAGAQLPLLPEPPEVTPDLASYDWIISNSSAGKDSQAMLDRLAELCRALGILDRLVVVHADLGRVEWPGVPALAEEHARHYGLRFILTRRRQGDLLAHVRQRRLWPAPKTRYCTSDHKRAQVRRVMTALVDELRAHRPELQGPVRILNCMGLRAEESPARAKLAAFEHEVDASNGRRHVDRWLPIQIERDIIAAGIEAVSADLLRDDLGAPERTIANLLSIFARDPRWTGVLAYHALRECSSIVELPPWHPDDAGAERARGDWSEQDSTRAAAWLAREWRIFAPTPLVEEAIETVARRVIVDPLAGYLQGLRWDGTPRIDRWLSRYADAADTPYTQAIGARWLISAVARALRPGCKVDCVLILESPQGRGKSSMLRALCHDDSLFLDDELEIGNKDAAQVLRGKWLVELGELSALSRSQLHAQKSFITRQIDTYRPSFGRRSKDFPRRCVFAGSTNEETYLRDDENRRYWPVRCGRRIDVEGILADRDQLWAEAAHRYRAGERWHVDTPELVALCREQQELRAQPDPWEQWIGDWLDGELRARPCDARILGDRCGCPACAGLTTGQALAGGVQLEKGRQSRADEMRAAAVFRRLGWKRGPQTQRKGTRVYPYFPPSATDGPECSSTSEVGDVR